MTVSPFDFSDIIFVNEEWPRPPARLDGLSTGDSAIVRWLTRLVESQDAGELDVGCIAWLMARTLCPGGMIVWLAQERTLLDAGVREILAECAELVPEPWAGFLRWSSDETNLETFRAWPAYTSEDHFDERRAPRARKPKPRRRR